MGIAVTGTWTLDEDVLSNGGEVTLTTETTAVEAELLIGTDLAHKLNRHVLTMLDGQPSVIVAPAGPRYGQLVYLCHSAEEAAALLERYVAPEPVTLLMRGSVYPHGLVHVASGDPRVVPADPGMGPATSWQVTVPVQEVTA